SASLECLVDRRATIRHVSRPAERLRHFAEEGQIARLESALGKLLECGAQNAQSIDNAALPDAQYAIEAAPRGMPQGKRMPCRVTEQHRHVTLRPRQIADRQRGRACALAERIA